ncbi:WbqC family protein [candidate division KSB1 bacterium]|nr:WbqC family protein [candidate division KSB1 bacterium]
MILTVLTPAYFPPLRIFARAARADHLVWADTFGFNRQTLMHRTAIKTRNGRYWLTIPVLKKTCDRQSIAEMHIDTSQRWVRTHLRSLELAYRNTPFFYLYWDELASLLDQKWERLIDLLSACRRFCLKHLAIDKPIHNASELPPVDDRTERVIAWCRAISATRYLLESGQTELLRSDLLECNGIQKAEFHSSLHPHTQLFGTFLECGVLDALFNLGPESRIRLADGQIHFHKTGESTERKER